MATKKSKMKGFTRKEVLIIDVHSMPQDFLDIYYERENRQHDYQKYWSEFNPSGKEDYATTFTQENLEDYWKDQTRDNNYKGTLEDFIKDYGLELDVWFINCGYDFTGVKEIILNY